MRMRTASFVLVLFLLVLTSAAASANSSPSSSSKHVNRIRLIDALDPQELEEIRAAAAAEAAMQQSNPSRESVTAVVPEAIVSSPVVPPIEPTSFVLPPTIDSSNIASVFHQVHDDDLPIQEAFTHFKRKHHRRYRNKKHEAERFSIFKQNVKKAKELKKKNPTAEFGINQFSDMHPEEFKKKYLNFKPVDDAKSQAAVLRQEKIRKSTIGQSSLLKKARKIATTAALPTNFDWRKPDKNRPVAVTPVKDQGQCGSCWAFSATEELESMWILAGNKPVALSTQQTVDCDTVDQGCNGGDTVSAYAYIEAHGVQTESSYPYQSGLTGVNSTCEFRAANIAAKMRSFSYATPGCNDSCAHQDEEALAASLYTTGPVSVCVDASTWQWYTGGIMTAASGCGSAYSALDHCVQLTGFGYDTSLGQKYWSIRNSWATGWGEDGYIRLLFGANTCGVADEATIVQV